MAKRRGKPPRIPQLGNHGLDDALHEYATSFSSAEPSGLAALRRATWTQTVKPQMLCDELQGRLLAALSHMIAPTRVLELGTFTGYATACWAEGLAPDGTIDTVDVNDELHSIQDKHWSELGIVNCIRRHTGKAMDILKKDFNYHPAFKKGTNDEITGTFFTPKKHTPRKPHTPRKA